MAEQPAVAAVVAVVATVVAVDLRQTLAAAMAPLVVVVQQEQIAGLPM